MHTYYELELLGLEFHTLLSILKTHEMSVANILLLEFYLLPLEYIIVIKVRVLQDVLWEEESCLPTYISNFFTSQEQPF